MKNNIEFSQPLRISFEQIISRKTYFDIKDMNELDQFLNDLEVDYDENTFEEDYFDGDIFYDSHGDINEQYYTFLKIPDELKDIMEHTMKVMNKKQLELSCLKFIIDNNMVKPYDNETLKLFPDE